MKEKCYRYILILWIAWLPFKLNGQTYNQSIDSINAAIGGLNEDTVKVNLLLKQSFNYLGIRDYSNSMDFANKALKLSDTLHFTRGQYKSYNLLGINENHVNNLPAALHHFKNSLVICETLGNKYNISLLCNNIGNIYAAQSNYTEAINYYLYSLKLKKQIGDLKNIPLTLRNIGNLYSNQGEYAKSLVNLLEAIRLYEELGDQAGLSSCYVDIGGTYGKIGNFSESLKYTLLSLKINIKIGNKQGMATAYGNIGVIYLVQKDYANALINFTNGLQLQEELNYKPGMHATNINIGKCYFVEKNYAVALKFLKESLKIAKEIDRSYELAESYFALGTLYSTQNNPDSAFHYLYRALNNFEKISNKVGISKTLRNLSETMISFDSTRLSKDPTVLDTALQYANRGLHIGIETGDHQNILNAQIVIYKVYKKMGNYAKALEYHKLSNNLKDSLLNNESTRKLEQLRTQYEVEKAIASEKAQQDSLLAEQKFQSDKEQAEINARHQLEIAEAKAQEERAIEAARYRYLLQLAAAKTEQEKQLAEQQFQNELRIAEENARHRIALAEEKAKQERKEAETAEVLKREKAERGRRAQIALAGGALLALLAFFFILYRRQQTLRQKAIEKAEVAHQMAELELQSLRAQLNPHFMFNSLNAIQELILLEENDKSHTYLARFAKLLRMLLENANSPFIPLAREMEFLELYLSLEQLRIPDLQYKFAIDPSINLETIRIPNMILQPYIENAIWHGLSHKQAGDRAILIRVNQDSMGVNYEIEDNGVGRLRAAELKSAYRKEHKSKGMELLTKRFKLLSEEYRSDIETHVTDIVQNERATGTRVAITVPWEMAREMKKTA